MGQSKVDGNDLDHPGNSVGKSTLQVKTSSKICLLLLKNNLFGQRRPQVKMTRISQCKESKTCVKRPLKNRQKTKILMTNGSLMKVGRIAE